MREYKITESAHTQRMSFTCTSCKAYKVMDVDVCIKRTSWWCNGPQSSRAETVMTPNVRWVKQSKMYATTCTCTATTYAKIFKISLTDHKCDARCMASKGHICECSCGGKNHGKKYE